MMGSPSLLTVVGEIATPVKITGSAAAMSDATAISGSGGIPPSGVALPGTLNVAAFTGVGAAIPGPARLNFPAVMLPRA